MRRLVIPLTLLACWAALVAVGGGVAPWIVLPVAFALLSGVILVASMNAPLQLFGPALVRGPADSGAVALTFDDGPDPSFTPAVLDALDAAGAKGTFFLVGSRAEQSPEVTRQIVERGHQVGHHSYDHRWTLMFVRPRLEADFDRASRAIAAAAGVVPRFFRPPVGIVAPEVLDVAASAGTTLTTWSVRPFDGRIDDAPEVRRRVASKIGPGDIVLLHDASFRARRTPPAVEALPGILEDLRARNLRSVTLAELTGQAPYLTEDELKQPRPQRRSRLPLFVAATALALLLGSAAYAHAGELPPTLVEAADALAKNETVQARFTQTKTSILFIEPDVSTGELLLRRSDGRIVWAYDGGPAILIAGGRIYPLGSSEHVDGIPIPGGAGLTAMFDALFRVEPEALAEHFEGTAQGEGTFALVPTSDGAKALFTRVELTIAGSPTVLQKVVMSEVTGDVTTIEFSDTKPNAALEDDRLQTPRERGKTP